MDGKGIRWLLFLATFLASSTVAVSHTKPVCWCRKSDSPVRDGLRTKRVVSRREMRREQDGLVSGVRLCTCSWQQPILG